LKRPTSVRTAEIAVLIHDAFALQQNAPSPALMIAMLSRVPAVVSILFVCFLDCFTFSFLFSFCLSPASSFHSSFSFLIAD
jgi:hypothetical protein